ncbi:thiamine pyrophosphate-dependent enzyme [Halobacterium bonnevillei]|uniref:2-oxo-3-methylvalerate dehydrogenase E1 component subunit alpha n=1 Tax=Halobacterium bonnevillei TaxID=2692200 RepID=A0A6B0SDP0_9EURY|nr:thiamine pyrophosphate-dependent enzyme [Halobacterium bonnevillei]MXR19854.1 2-oxo-3-methylvalerate dehydrogenase E1 component subunit alpha [Halobacterium bonnevillei]
MSENEPTEHPANATVSAGEPRFLTQDDLSVDTHQVVAPDGSYDADEVPDLDDEQFQDLYRWMLTDRVFSKRMVNIQRRGELGTFGSTRGQEASIIGSAYTLQPDDWLYVGRAWTPMFMRGVPMKDMIMFWRGIEEGQQSFAEHNCQIAISIGSHLPLVAGLAWGMDLSGDDAIATAYLGDGATSTGAAHEAINFAGALEVPALFYCQNNQYAISLSAEEQTGANTLAQKALAYGMDAIRVDGQDVLAVYEAVNEARKRVRNGEPVFVESVTYRMDAHTTSDDPTRYRSDEEVDAWEDADPLERYREFLRAEGLWDDIDHDAIEAEIDAEFDAALEEANAFEERGVEEIFAHVYAELPPDLQRQSEEFSDLLERRPELYDYIEQRPKG